MERARLEEIYEWVKQEHPLAVEVQEGRFLWWRDNILLRSTERYREAYDMNQDARLVLQFDILKGEYVELRKS